MLPGVLKTNKMAMPLPLWLSYSFPSSYFLWGTVSMVVYYVVQMAPTLPDHTSSQKEAAGLRFCKKYCCAPTYLDQL